MDNEIPSAVVVVVWRAVVNDFEYLYSFHPENAALVNPRVSFFIQNFRGVSLIKMKFASNKALRIEMQELWDPDPASHLSDSHANWSVSVRFYSVRRSRSREADIISMMEHFKFHSRQRQIRTTCCETEDVLFFLSLEQSWSFSLATVPICIGMSADSHTTILIGIGMVVDSHATLDIILHCKSDNVITDNELSTNRTICHLSARPIPIILSYRGKAEISNRDSHP